MANCPQCKISPNSFGGLFFDHIRHGAIQCGNCSTLLVLPGNASVRGAVLASFYLIMLVFVVPFDAALLRMPGLRLVPILVLIVVTEAIYAWIGPLYAATAADIRSLREMSVLQRSFGYSAIVLAIILVLLIAIK